MRTIWWVVVVWNETPRNVLTLNASNVTQHFRRSPQLDALSNILSTSAHHIWWWRSYTFRYMNNIDFVKWQLFLNPIFTTYCSKRMTMSESMRQSISPQDMTGLLSSLATYQHWYFVHTLGKLGRMEVDSFYHVCPKPFHAQQTSINERDTKMMPWWILSLSLSAAREWRAITYITLLFRGGWSSSIICSQDH